MRISDWSSDVCSSDLPGQTARASHYRLRFLRKDLILRQPFLLMAGLSLLGYASTAFAGDYRYAHKAGVSASMIESDESGCFEAAKLAMHKPSAPNPYNPATQSTAAGAAGAALAHGFGEGLKVAEHSRKHNSTASGLRGK